MPCDPQMLRQVPLFELFDDDELAALAAQVELEEFRPHQRIYRLGDMGEHAAALKAPVIMMSQDRQDKKDRLRGELDYDVTGARNLKVASWRRS